MDRVLMISYLFPPTAGSGVQRSLYFAKYLPAFGYRPIVLRGGTRPGREGEDPSLVREVEDAVRITEPAAEPACLFENVLGWLGKRGRVGGAVAWRGRRLLRRFERRLSPDELVFWSRRALPRVRSAIARYRPSVLYSTSPPICNHYVAWRLKQETGLPWVADFRDLWTQDWGYQAGPAFSQRRDRTYERAFLCDADAVIGVTAGYVRKLKTLVHDEKHDRFHLIRNGVDLQAFPVEPPAPADEFRLVFTGLMNGDRWSDALVEALRRINADGTRRVTWQVAGTLDDRHLRQATELLGKQFSFEGYGPLGQARQMILQAGALLIQTIRGGGVKLNVPGKFYEYLATGRPILCLSESTSPDVEMVDLIRCHNAGLVCQMDDVDAIQDALVRLHDAWAQGSCQYGAARDEVERYDRRALTGRLAEVFRAVTPGAEPLSTSDVLRSLSGAREEQ